jgi:hypothetical protein
LVCDVTRTAGTKPRLFIYLDEGPLALCCGGCQRYSSRFATLRTVKAL